MQRDFFMMPRALVVLLVCLAIPGCRPVSNSNPAPTMINPVNYFEIPVTDLSRAIKFYEAVFECRLETRTVDGNQMAVFPGSLDQPGISGALACGTSYKPSIDGTRIYFASSNIRAVLERVLKNGGRIEYPVTEIGELGSVAEFIDSEGNRIALHQPPAAE